MVQGPIYLSIYRASNEKYNSRLTRARVLDNANVARVKYFRTRINAAVGWTSGCSPVDTRPTNIYFPLKPPTFLKLRLVCTHTHHRDADPPPPARNTAQIVYRRNIANVETLVFFRYIFRLSPPRTLIYIIVFPCQ